MSFTVRQSRMRLARMALVITSAIFGLADISNAQVVNPADKQGPPSAAPSSDEHIPTWKMPPVDVYGNAPLKEEDRIGAYAQPRWTAHRRFGETRVYVIPKGMSDFEYWSIPETGKDGVTEWKTQYEMEFGLPNHMQLDLYAVSHKVGNQNAYGIDGQKVELRWAFADWNKIPGNPTLYMEWGQNNNAPDHAEIKMLLGGEIKSGWHWGSNFVFEHETGGAQENSNEWTTGLSYSVRDSKVSIGTETQLALVNTKIASGKRGAFEKQFVIGPSIQIRPVPQMHVDIAPLIGVTHDAPRSRVYVVVGWEF